MRKLLDYITVSILTVFPFIFLHCTGTEDYYLAQVESYSISVNDFQERYQKFLISTGITDRPSARQQLLEGMVGEILLLHLDDNQNIFDDPGYKAVQDRVRKEVLLAYYKSEEIQKKITVDDEDLRKEFLRVNQKVSVRHLFTRDKVEANRLLSQLQNGFTFQQLAPLVFDDDSLAGNGGYLGYITWGDMDPAFEEAAYSLTIGEISKPVRTVYGYSIIKVEDRIQRPLLTESEFIAKKNQLRRMMYIRENSKMGRKFLNQILSEMRINIDQKGLEEVARQLGILPPENVSNQESLVSMALMTYGDKVMSTEKALVELNNLPPSSKRHIRTLPALESALKGVAVQDWLVTDAEDKGYDQVPVVMKKQQLWSNEKFLQFKRRQIFKDMIIPDSSISSYYQQHKNEFISEEKVSIQEILLDSESLAQEILDKLNNGSNFSDLVRKYSIRKNAKLTNGITGLMPVSSFGDISHYFRESEIGKIIGPLKMDEYFIIAQVIDGQEKRLLSFPEVKSAIKDVLKQEAERSNFASYIKNLSNQHKVKINNKLLLEITDSDDDKTIN